MNNADKSKEQLIAELTATRQELKERVAEHTKELQNTNAQLLAQISERERIERTLREQQTRLSLVLQAGNHGFWDWNIITGDLYMDPNWHRILGYNQGDVDLNIHTLEEICHPEDLPLVTALINDHLSGAATTPYEVEHRFRTKSGEWKWVSARGKVVERDNTGQAIRMIGTATDIDNNKAAEQLVRDSLKEKEVMLKEIHHRVKNNLQIVSSLLHLQSRTITDEHIRQQFVESQNRIHSMAIIHEQLYRSEDLAHIDMSRYVWALSQQLRRIYRVYAVQFKIDVVDVWLSVDSAIPCGLIINELVSNAMKYAFTHAAGDVANKIEISLHPIGNQIQLQVSDNGQGLPDNFDLHNVTSLGLTLIRALTDQLEGALTWSSGPGLTVSVLFAPEL